MEFSEDTRDALKYELSRLETVSDLVLIVHEELVAAGVVNMSEFEKISSLLEEEAHLQSFVSHFDF